MDSPDNMTRIRTLRAVFFIAAALLVSATGFFPLDARAQPRAESSDPQLVEAQRLFDEGQAAARAREFRKAIPVYERALALRERVLGQTSGALVPLTDALAEAHRELADYKSALVYFQRSLAIVEAAIGPLHPRVATLLNNMADLYQDMGEYAKALPLVERSLAIYEAAFSPSHTSVAMSLNSLAAVHQAMGEYAKALPLFVRSLAIYETALGPSHPNVARLLSNLASLYQDMDDHAKALPLFARSLAIHEKALDQSPRDVARGLSELAYSYRMIGEYSKARPLFERSLAIRENAFGPQHPDVAMSLNDLGMLYENNGEYAKALSFIERGLTIRENALGPLHSDVAKSLNNLAFLHQNTGEYSKALSLFQRSVEIHEKVSGPTHPDVVTSLSNLALLYSDMGEYSKAQLLLERGLAIREKALGLSNQKLASSLNNLATLYAKTGQYANALPLVERSLAIHETIYGPSHPAVGTLLNNLAFLYRYMDEYPKALQLYERSLAIDEIFLGPKHPNLAMSLNNVAGLNYAMGEYTKALPLLERALAIASHSNTPEAAWRAQGGIQVVQARLGRPELAVFFGKQAVNTIQGMRARLTEFDRELQRSFLRDKVPAYRDLADLLIAGGRLAEAQQVLGMLKEDEFFEFIRRSETDDPRQRRIEFQLHEAPWQARFQAMLGKATEADLQRYFTEIRSAFTTRTGTQVAESADAIANRAALQSTLATLGVGSVMLHFVQAGDRLSIITTTAGSQTARQINLKAVDLNTQINRLRRLLRSPDSNVLPAAQALYQTLIAPVAAELDKADTRTLMFYLDGSLRYIPMAVLHDGKQYLAERYALAVYTEVARDNMTRAPQSSRTIAGLGLTRAIGEFDSLPAVKDELAAIVKSGATGLIPGEMHFDQDFSAKRLQASLVHPLVHVASHFVFRPGTEATSFLLLGDGDRLTLKRIRDDKFDFSKVDLLTLSACETGVGGGRDAQGQEVEGLAVLVQRQGAKAVIATLWPVADESTALFMQHMYRLRETNLTKAEALRQAQLALIKSVGNVRADFGHPFYWAPFILMGNWL